MLLDGGADVNKECVVTLAKDGAEVGRWTPLLHMMYPEEKRMITDPKRSLQAVQALLDAGADVNREGVLTDDNETLRCTAMFGILKCWTPLLVMQ